jgi:rhamnose utilization protein RhaD (predicted bifunctional aldolase and dehydrogenase)
MDEFINIARELGQNILYMQGAGGNASIKIKNKMYIKASGYKLKNISTDHGYACCQYKPLSDFINQKKSYMSSHEEQFLLLIDSLLIKSETFGSPSMETGFHAVIQSKYVFHLHSVYANIFGCMKYGSRYLDKLSNTIPHTIIDYKTPGYELAFHLSKKQNLPPLIFLKNHGIIVHGDTTVSCLRIIRDIHISIENYLQENHIFSRFEITSVYKPMRKYLFPDSAVFANTNLENIPKYKHSELLEIMSAQRYILDSIKRQGKKPSYLSVNAVKKLLNMKQEKHRQELFKS